jgi:DHA2 family multidrug resistance protein-like MFS transporter
MTPSKAGRREWIGLAILALPTLLISMDTTVLFLAVPAISASLEPSSTQLLWITDMYGFMQAGLLIIMGTIGDRIGRRRILVGGAIAFAAASVLAAFSPNAPLLILSRGLLGVAGATLLPSVVSLIRNMFHDEQQRTFALGCWTTCFSTGTMLGPLVGGLLLSHFWWGSVFLMGVPVMLLFLVLAPLYLPEYRHPTDDRIDLPSAAEFLAAVLLVTYGLKRMAAGGGDLRVAGCLGVGIVLAWIFVRRQQKLPHPLMDPAFFRSAAFNATALALFLALFNWAGLSYFAGQYLQLVLNLDPTRAGIWTIPGAVGSIIGCQAAPQAIRRWPRATVVGVSMVMASLGAFLCAFLPAQGGVSVLVVATMVLCIGTGATVTLGVAQILSMAPPGRAGAVAGLYETSTNLGSSLGIALLGSIGVAVYRARIHGGLSMAPGGLPATPGGLPTTLGGLKVLLAQHTDLLDQARGAFTASFHTAAVVAGLLMGGAAFVSFAVLRRRAQLPA